MKTLKALLLGTCKIIFIPLFIMVTWDKACLIRAKEKNGYYLSDFLPHLTILLISIFFFMLLTLGLVNINHVKFEVFLSDLVKIEGVLMAGGIAVSTFILNSLKVALQASIASKDSSKEETINYVINDLKLANRIIFISLLVTIGLMSSLMSFDWINNYTISIVLFFALWSITAIESLIRNVFLFVYIK